MNKDQGALLFLARSGMDLSWLYAWATFLTTAIMQRPFPLAEAIGTYLLAAALSRIIWGTGLRMISVLGIQILGFLLAASRIVYTFSYRAYPYLGKAWLVEFFGRTRGSMEWLLLVLILVCALVFWLKGVALIRKPPAYFYICTRFDYGVAAFFCLFFIKYLLLAKGGIEVKDAAPMILLFPFFIFGLLAIGLARNRSSAKRDFLAGYRGVGVLVSFSVVVLAFGAGMVLLFLPYLGAAAEAGYGVLTSAAGPLVPVLIRVLKFVFQRGEHLSYPLKDNEPEFIPAVERSGWSQLVESDLGGVILGLGLLIGLILCVIGVWYLVRWLFSRTPKEERKHIHWQMMLLWVQKVWAALFIGLQRAVRSLEDCQDAVQLYRALLRWGRRSGRPHLLSETPAEYGSRLRKQIPFLSAEITGIVEAFNLVVYGEVDLDAEQIALARLSWKKLRRPRYWPARLKTWFLQEKGRPL